MNIQSALQNGFSSIIADGSHLEYRQNINFTRQMAALVHNGGVRNVHGEYRTEPRLDYSRIEVMNESSAAMQSVVAGKLRLFRSSGHAKELL